MKRFQHLAVISALAALSCALPQGHAQSASDEPEGGPFVGSTFTYQGQLKLNGNAVHASADFQFSLHDGPGLAANQIGPLLGANGINLINATLPGSYSEFGEHVMPVLRDRGLANEAYTPGTLRHKIFGRDRLPDTHPAAAYRNAFR